MAYREFRSPVTCPIARYTAVASITPVRGAWILLTVFGSCYQMLFKNSKHRQLMCGDIVLHVPLGAHIPDSETILLLDIAWHCHKNVVFPIKTHNHTSMGAISLYNCALLARETRQNEHLPKTAPLQYSLQLSCEKNCNASPLVDLLQNPNLLKAMLNVRVKIQIVPRAWLEAKNHRHTRLEHIAPEMDCNALSLSTLTLDGRHFVYNASIVEGAKPRRTLSPAQLVHVASQRNLDLLPSLQLPPPTHEIFTLEQFIGAHRRCASSETTSHIGRLVEIGAALLQLIASKMKFYECIGFLIRPFDVYDSAVLLETCPYMRLYLGAFLPRISDRRK